MKTLFKLPIKKILNLLSYGGIGAGLGWLVADVLIYQLMEKEVSYTDEDYAEIVESYLGPDEKHWDFSIVKSDSKPKVINYAEKFKDGKLLGVASWTLKEPEDTPLPTEYVEEDPELNKIYIISEEEYEDDEELLKVPMVYYEEDDVITYINDQIVTDPEQFIGGDALLCFGDETEDPDLVHIRNLDSNALYQISRVHGSYEKSVLGLKKIKAKKKKVVTDDTE